MPGAAAPRTGSHFPYPASTVRSRQCRVLRFHAASRARGSRTGAPTASRRAVARIGEPPPRHPSFIGVAPPHRLLLRRDDATPSHAAAVASFAGRRLPRERPRCPAQCLAEQHLAPPVAVYPEPGSPLFIYPTEAKCRRRLRRSRRPVRLPRTLLFRAPPRPLPTLECVAVRAGHSSGQAALPRARRAGGRLTGLRLDERPGPHPAFADQLRQPYARPSVQRHRSNFSGFGSGTLKAYLFCEIKFKYPPNCQNSLEIVQTSEKCKLKFI
jgi:hypothetical protein